MRCQRFVQLEALVENEAKQVESRWDEDSFRWERGINV